MISRFFIDRPIFASVLSIVITLAGGIALLFLPLALYPPISPPNVSVDCSYPGASAQVVSETVATPIEQQVNGVEDMLYMSSQCTNDGAYNLTVTFKHGVDLNLAQVLVQNRIALALPQLPDVLKQAGVNVRKRSPDILMAIAINSPNNTRDQLFLSNYALLHVKEQLARVEGVSDVLQLGQRDYSMRIWVDPDKLATRSMTADDVVNAVRQQNMQVATGQIGQPPAPDGQPIQVPLTTKGRLTTVEEFGAIIVKASTDGRLTRLKEVARIELGSKNQDISGRVNSRPSVSLAVFQLPDANALDVADTVKAKIEELSKDFPPGVHYEIRYDTTPFIRESIGEVVKTLEEAIILVGVVVLLFLQNWRSALIPLIAVPVAIIGTFAVMAAMGFSLNNLTLFGLVLAIGIVVDDAIVVVEAVEHHIERGMSPRDATYRAMDEVSGPVIAIGLVLSAVFVPCAFISGIVGQFFRQFALTIAVSTIISAFNSLTLSPALAALLLKPRSAGPSRDVLPRYVYMVIGGYLGWDRLQPWTDSHLGTWLSASHAGPRGVEIAAALIGAVAGLAAWWPANRILSAFFGLFNAGFRRATNLYTRTVGGLLRVSALVLLVYAGMLGLTYWEFRTTPTGFIPSQDMGYLLVNVQLPDSTSLERTMAVTDKMEKIAHDTGDPILKGVKHSQAMSGQSMLLSANGSNFGSMFLIFDEYSKRPDPVKERLLSWMGDVVLSLDATSSSWYGWLSTQSLTGTLDSIAPDLKSIVVTEEGTGKPFRLQLTPTTTLVNASEAKLGAVDLLPGDRVDVEHLRGIASRVAERPKENVVVRWLGSGSRRAGRALHLTQARFWLRDRLTSPKDVVKTWFARRMGLDTEKVTVPGPPGRAPGTMTMLKPKPVGKVVPPSVPLGGEAFADRFRELLHLGKKEPSLSGDAIANQLRKRFAQDIPDAMVTVLGPPPVRGVGRAGGFKLMIEDRGDNGLKTLQTQTDDITERLKQSKNLVGMTSVFRANVPQIFVDVDRRECMSKGVQLRDLFDTLRVNLGSLYVNDFNLFGRTWQVIVQADQKFRNSVETVQRLKVRNNRGGMVPVGTLARVEEINGPLVLSRYNMYPAAPINGAAAPGASSGDAIAEVTTAANEMLPPSMAFEWTELAYLEILAGNTAMVVFGFAVVMVFLVLAAQYESWSMPLAVILVVPMCLLSAVTGVRASFQDINIFTQIGFVVLVGLASKNAILIVEFAKHRRAEGESTRQAALDACQLRLRPIVMTSLAFILGVLPLILSQGAGAEMRRTLGITVFSGMLGVTAFGIFLTPVFFSVIDTAGESRVFRWKPLRFVSDALLSVLTLGFLRPALRLMSKKPGPGGKAAVNGKVAAKKRMFKGKNKRGSAPAPVFDAAPAPADGPADQGIRNGPAPADATGETPGTPVERL